MSDTQKKIFMIKNVRISYPHLHEKTQYDSSSPLRYSASFILDKVDDAEMIKELQKEFKSLAKTTFGKEKLAADKVCLTDGDLSDKEEYQGAMILSSSNKRRPLVLNKKMETVSDVDECSIVGGYRVNAKVSLWAVSKAKRIASNLIAVQFAAKDEVFGQGEMDEDQLKDGFDVMPSSDDDAEEWD